MKYKKSAAASPGEILWDMLNDKFDFTNHAFTFSGSGLVYQWRARTSQGIDTALLSF
jgi:hypothetical protein